MTAQRRPHRLSRLTSVVALLTACTGEASLGLDASPNAMPRHTVPVCAAFDERPSFDDHCTPIGARDPLHATGWPALGEVDAPVVFVAPMVSAGGDGSMDHPFATIAAALAATPSARTIVLAAGTHRIDASVPITRVLTIVGAGSRADGGTVIDAASTMSAVAVRGADGDLTMTGLRITYAADHPDDHAAFAIDVTAGAHATLDEVAIEHAWVGVRVDAAVVTATHLTILGSGGRGISLDHGADGNFESVVVRDGAGNGVVAEAAVLTLRDALVRGKARSGIALLGGVALQPHRLDDVTSIANGITAMRAENANCAVTAKRLVLGATIVPMGSSGGDGLYVGPGASVSIDADATTSDLGARTRIVGNARTGVLVSGSDAAGVAPGTLVMGGATIGSNTGPGVFVQSRGVLARAAFVAIDDNGALGLGVTSGGVLTSLEGSIVSNTRAHELVTESATLTLADGLSMADGTSAASITDTRFDDNARFALVFSHAGATLERNTGERNGYAIGVYDSTVPIASSNAITALHPSPTWPPPIFRGAFQ